jgi:hypothetical protein
MAGDMWEPWFQRLLAQEAGTVDTAGAIAAAARRLCEHLARHVSPLVGASGIAAIWTRSLYLARRQFPWIAPLEARNQQADGTRARVTKRDDVSVVASAGWRRVGWHRSRSETCVV